MSFTSSPLASISLLPTANGTMSRSLNIRVEQLQRINMSNLKQHERDLLADAIRATETLSNSRQSLSAQEAHCSLLEAIERFLNKQASRSCFRLICYRLLRLFNRNDEHLPCTTTEGYRTGLQCFLEQRNESQGSSSEAEATAVTPMQENQEDTISSQTPQIPHSASSSADSPSAALGSQYSPTTPSGPGSPSSPVPHPHPHPYSYPSPSPLPYTFPNPFFYPSPYSSSSYPYAHPSPPIIAIHITNIGNDNRTTTPMVDIESLSMS